MTKASIEDNVHRLLDQGYERVPVIAGKLTSVHAKDTDDFTDLVAAINQAKKTYEEADENEDDAATTSSEPEETAEEEPTEDTAENYLDVELMENDEPVEAAGESGQAQLSFDTTDNSSADASASSADSGGAAAASSSGGGTTTTDTADSDDSEPDVEELFPSDDPLGIDS